MTDCEHLTDRMPEVALGRSAWTAEESAHLAACADCRAAWAIVRSATALGRDTAPALDTGALAAALQARLAADAGSRRRSRRVWSSVAAGAAAAAVLVAVVSRSGAPPAPQIATEQPALVPLPELEGLETADLDTLLQTIDRPVAGASTLDASTLGEHEDGELEQVFATWEG